MPKLLFLDSVAGVAGDMFTAAFLDAGLVTLDDLNDLVSALGLSGVRVQAEQVLTASIIATQLSIVATDDAWTANFPIETASGGLTNDHASPDETTNLVLTGEAKHWHVHYPVIDRFLADSHLDQDVKNLARRILRTLAEAEASVHGIDIEKAAFHELGTLDSILDVVMAAFCLVRSEADEYAATAIKTGRGSIRIAHGTHRVPPPASARLLIGLETAETPSGILRDNVELSTPTGIAILKAISPRFISEPPAGKLTAIGRGCGKMDLGAYPNTFQVSVVESVAIPVDLPFESDQIVEIVCNIDDDTGEHLAWIAEKLLEKGCLDVWQTSIVGKKGRSAICLHALTKPEDLNQIADWILRNGTTFGLRYRAWDRLKLVREFQDNDEGRVKIGSTTTGERLKQKREFDDWKKKAQ